MTDQGRNSYRRRYGRFWRQAVGRSNRIIQSIYTNLRSRDTSNVNIGQLTTHSRSIISETVRCIDHSSRATRRNMRDLTILHNAIAITDNFRHMFVLYAQNRITFLLNQANSQQQRHSRSVRHHRKTKIRTKHILRKRWKPKKSKRKHHPRVIRRRRKNIFNHKSNGSNKPSVFIEKKANFFYSRSITVSSFEGGEI